MIFPCCNNLYCCGHCHNQDQDHYAVKTPLMVCFDCGSTQNLRYEPNNCEKCKSFHPTLKAGNSNRIPTSFIPCSAYSNISYFMVFPCCNNLYCCPTCHNNKETHSGQKCLDMVCFHCGGKQKLRNEPNRCDICNRNHPALIAKGINRN